MDTEESGPGYQVWGADYSAYGPVELPTLVNWIKDERVLAETWIFSEEAKTWSRAAEIPELKMFFSGRGQSQINGRSSEQNRNSLGIKPGSLRRIKIFADFSDDELNAFLSYMELVRVGPFFHVVRKGDPGDAMYLVLEGELRSCIFIDGIESPVTTLPPGSVFGEISLLDGGPHAAEVISNQESALIKISSEAFKKVVKESPALALPFLLCLSKAIAGRVRILTKRYEDSVHLAQVSEV